METDFFNIPEIHIDLFESEVDALVISAYRAAIDGIDRLDNRGRPRGDLASNPGLQVEINFWDEQISAMKRHAGSIGLVSLVILIDRWHARHGKFQECATLSRTQWEEIRNARHSIVHHGDRQFGNPPKVTERFLDFDEPSNEERIAVTESLLKDVAGELTSYVKERIKQKNHNH